MNVMRRNEPVSTDQIYSDTPSYGGGYTIAQFYTVLQTKVCDIIPIKNEGDFPSEKLISKNAPLVITSAIFVVQCSQISWKIFIICLHLIQNFKVETLSWNYLWTVDTLKLHPGKLLFFTKTNFTR